MHNILEVKNLVTHFYTQDGVVKAVDGVSYHVGQGETIALVGESGCGKSVSALSILRLIQEPPGKILGGQILFNGSDLLTLSRREMQSIRGNKISMIFQEPLTSLNPVLTIGLQISEALEFHRNMRRQAALSEAVRLLQMVGIPHPDRRVKEYPHNFSGGMRQRVMIAMAISCHPQLIIADEPTTAVDVTVQAQLLELIRSLILELNSSLIMITHNLGIVARYAQRVYVMYAGRIVEFGPAEEVFHKPAHPYTKGLLASVPRLDEPKKVRLSPIVGQPPDLISPPKGCGFEPRCDYAFAECPLKHPELKVIGKDHYSACLLAHSGKLEWKKN
jgi:oligopeptide/dipeptide ABC transporter ATP-binding protein